MLSTYAKYIYIIICTCDVSFNVVTTRLTKLRIRYCEIDEHLATA